MKTINKEVIASAIKAAKWDKASFHYAVSFMRPAGDFIGYDWYTKKELVEQFWSLVETRFSVIAGFTTFNGFECFTEVVTPVIHETITFISVINLENSFGSVELADNAESTIEVESRADGTGWFEWDIDELSEVESGYLEFEGNKLVGYDGVFSLPVQLLDFLDSKGFNTEEVR